VVELTPSLQKLSDNVQLVVFDWDGTLEDSASAIVLSIEQTLIEIGMNPPERHAIRNVIGLSYQAGLAELFPHEDIDHLVARCSAVASRPVGGPCELYAGVIDTLDQLSAAGIWLAIATGKSRAGLERALGETNLNRYFLTTRTADDAPSKPHPAMLESILDELGVSPDDALMVGDTVWDLQLAFNARVGSIAVTCGTHSEETLRQSDLALRILPDVAGLPRLLPHFDNPELRDELQARIGDPVQGDRATGDE